MGRKRFDPKGKANVFKMNDKEALEKKLLYRSLKERIKFKQSIDQLNKCRLTKCGIGLIPGHEYDVLSNEGKEEWKRLYNFRFPYYRIYHETLGSILFCDMCCSVMFQGNKQLPPLSL